MPQEGVILATVQPLNILFGLATSLVPFWSLLDAVQLDGLLGFLDGTVKVALSQLATLLVGNSIEGNHLCTVVFVAILLFNTTVDEGLRAVIIGIISGMERVPEASLCRIVLRRASTEK